MLLALMLCFGAAVAAGPGAARKRAESSMLVTGWIHIETDGSVSGYVLDHGDELPPVVTKLLDKAASNWKFEPVQVDGKPVRARTMMSVRLVAKRADDGKGFNVRVAGGNFGIPGGDDSPRKKALNPPIYPLNAADAGIAGTVYVILRVGRDGRIEDAIAEQVNLAVLVSEDGQERWRRVLAKAALDAATRWMFDPPTRGDEADEPFWLVRVPVSFLLPGRQLPKYGEWETYLPGPRQSAPWLGAIDTSLGADAVADGAIQSIGAGPKLLTPLGG
ncbi:MAG TPA: energy transducer TonB [Lysobacter sp.]